LAGTIYITLQAINVDTTYYSTGVQSFPSPTKFNIRTCATATCASSPYVTQIDDYQYATPNGGNVANVEMGFTGVLTTKLGITLVEMSPLMKDSQGNLIFSITLDGSLILYAYEYFQITHGLTYSLDKTCKVTTTTGAIDFRFQDCELLTNYIILRPKETITDLSSLTVVLTGVKTPAATMDGLYGQLKSGSIVI
jgi:hypothetical protein